MSSPAYDKGYADGIADALNGPARALLQAAENLLAADSAATRQALRAAVDAARNEIPE